MRGQAEAVERASDMARDTTADIREELLAQSEDMAQASEASVTRLTQLGELLSRRSEALDKAADNALSKTKELTNLFEAQTGAFRKVVTATATRLEEVGVGFLQHTEAMRRAADEANETSLRLRSQDLESRRDLFLRTAAMMIEDLNSQSVDLSRLLDGEVPGEVMKRWRKGDRSIFARLLVRSKDEGERLPEVRERYENDERFRSRVTRYIDQFEHLMNQAQNCDPENVLSATFLTADVGKLYLLLARSIGRTQ